MATAKKGLKTEPSTLLERIEEAGQKYKIETEVKKIFEQLEKAAPDINRECLKKNENAFSELYSHAFLQNIYSRADFASIRQKFKGLKKKSENFRKDIKHLTSKESRWLGNRHNPREDNFLSWLPLDDNKEEVNFIIEFLDNIIIRIDRTINELSFPNKEDFALYLFIINLIMLWKNCTNKKPTITFDPYNEVYKGPFLDFAYNSLLVLNRPPKSKNALGKRIQRQLKSHQR